MPVRLPDAELYELAVILDSGEFQVLRDRFNHPREVRQPLTDFTPLIWLFPFGVLPDLKQPVQVFLNGIVQWMDNECVLVPVGKREPITVVVLARPAVLGDTVQAIYTAVPRGTPTTT